MCNHLKWPLIDLHVSCQSPLHCKLHKSGEAQCCPRVLERAGPNVNPQEIFVSWLTEEDTLGCQGSPVFPLHIWAGLFWGTRVNEAHTLQAAFGQGKSLIKGNKKGQVFDRLHSPSRSWPRVHRKKWSDCTHITSNGSVSSEVILEKLSHGLWESRETRKWNSPVIYCNKPL